MVFDKIDINGDGEELSHAVPNCPLTRSAVCQGNSGCWMSQSTRTWGELAESGSRGRLTPHPLRRLQPCPGNTANCPSSYWQGGGLRGV